MASTIQASTACLGREALAGACPSDGGNPLGHPFEGWQRARVRQMLNVSAHGPTRATTTPVIPTRNECE